MSKLNNTIDIRPYQEGRKYVNVGNTIGKVFMQMQDWNIRRQTIRELNELTDAQLEDIGIPRYDIRRAVSAKIAQRSAVASGKSKLAQQPSVVRKDGHFANDRQLAA